MFKNVGERSAAKNYCPVSLLSVVSKVFEKLANNRIVGHLEKCGLFSDFQYGFRSSRSTADLLTVVFERIARAFNRSGVTRAVALDISKTFDGVWHAGLLHKLKSYSTSGQIFGLFSSFLSNRQLRVILDGKSSQEYPVNAGVPQGSILRPTLFLLYINDLPDDVICNIAIYADDTTLYSKCNQASDLWQQLELASELESDLRDTLDWGRKWLVDFSAGKTQLVLFDRSKSTGAIEVKMDGSLYSKCNQASDLWQQLELASELESDLRDTLDWGRKWLVDFSAGKTQLVLFDRSKSTGAIEVKMDGSLYSKCNQASDLWQQLELASELESDLRDTLDWGRKWLVDFSAGKTQLVLFDRSKSTGAIEVKMDGSLYSKCNQASDLWQQLELASELESDLRDTLDWGRKWLVDFSAGKTQLVLFDRSKSTGAIEVKMDGSVLEEKTSFKMVGLTLSFKLDWASYIVSIAKTASKKIGALIRSMKFLSPEVALHLYKSTIWPCMEYCYNIWAGAPSCYLELLDKLQKRICRAVGPSLAASLEPLAHHRNVASLSLFYRYYFGRCSSELA